MQSVLKATVLDMEHIPEGVELAMQISGAKAIKAKEKAHSLSWRWCAPGVFRIEQGGMYGWSAAKRRVAGEEDGEEGRGQDMKGSAAHSIKCGFNSKYGK